MNAFFKVTALAAAAATLGTALPAAAATSYQPAFQAPGEQVSNYGDRYDRGDWRRGYREDSRRGYRNDQRRYDNRGYNSNVRYWRGDNGRYYCRKQDGTTGLLIGGVAGALVGRGIDGGRDQTLGTVLGAAAGALLGREVDRGGSSCR